MANVPAGPPPLEELQGTLRALSHANRLRILWGVRHPTALEDVDLQPGASRAGGSPTRTLARQSAVEHLEQLLETGLVRPAPASGARPRYVLNRTALFQLTEQLRAFMAYDSGIETDPFDTAILNTNGDPTRSWPPGPKIVLVHGVQEGTVYPLQDNPKGAWTIGRGTDADVRLTHDPYASRRCAQLRRRGRDLLISELAPAKNPTKLNWRPLPSGDVTLQEGDVVGVGRSLLLYRSQ